MTPITNSEKERALDKARSYLSALYHYDIMDYEEFQYLMSKATENFDNKEKKELPLHKRWARERLIKLETLKDSVRKVLGYENFFHGGEHNSVSYHERYLKKVYTMIEALNKQLGSP